MLAEAYEWLAQKYGIRPLLVLLRTPLKTVGHEGKMRSLIGRCSADGDVIEVYLGRDALGTLAHEFEHAVDAKTGLPQPDTTISPMLTRKARPKLIEGRSLI